MLQHLELPALARSLFSRADKKFTCLRPLPHEHSEKLSIGITSKRLMESISWVCVALDHNKRLISHLEASPPIYLPQGATPKRAHHLYASRILRAGIDVHHLLHRLHISIPPQGVVPRFLYCRPVSPVCRIYMSGRANTGCLIQWCRE